MIKTTVTKIVLSDEEAHALSSSVSILSSIYNAMVNASTDATLTTSSGVDVSTEDFHRYIEFLWDVRQSEIKREACRFIIDEDIKEM